MGLHVKLQFEAVSAGHEGVKGGGDKVSLDLTNVTSALSKQAFLVSLPSSLCFYREQKDE